MMFYRLRTPHVQLLIHAGSTGQSGAAHAVLIAYQSLRPRLQGQTRQVYSWRHDSFVVIRIHANQITF